MNFPHDSVAATVRLRLRFLVTLTKAALSKFSDCFETIVIMGQSPLISVSQLLMTERSGPAQQGGGRL
jgi:hypothetical protein